MECNSTRTTIFLGKLGLIFGFFRRETTAEWNKLNLFEQKKAKYQGALTTQTYPTNEIVEGLK
jgi:hypothetical protein